MAPPANGIYTLVLPVAELNQLFIERLCSETINMLLAESDINHSLPDLSRYNFEHLTDVWLATEANRPELGEDCLLSMPLPSLAAEKHLLENTAIQTQVVNTVMQARCSARLADTFKPNSSRL